MKKKHSYRRRIFFCATGLKRSVGLAVFAGGIGMVLGFLLATSGIVVALILVAVGALLLCLN